MAKIDGIDIPKLIFTEGAAPSTPASAKSVLYVKSDGLFYSKDDAGTETPLGGGGGGEFTEFDVVNKNDGAFSTSSTTFVDVTGLSITQTTAAVRCIVTFSGVVNHSNANVIGSIDLDIDGTRVGETLGLLHFNMQSANDKYAVSFTYVTNVLTAASHTFKIQMKTAANTVALQAATTTSPARFQVLETSMAT